VEEFVGHILILREIYEIYNLNIIAKTRIVSMTGKMSNHLFYLTFRKYSHRKADLKLIFYQTGGYFKCPKRHSSKIAEMKTG